jgi:hypothetical protein
LPQGVFDYVDGAAEDEVTMARNAAAFRNVQFRPRVLRDVGTVDTYDVLGQPWRTRWSSRHRFTRMVEPQGEPPSLRRQRAGLPYRCRRWRRGRSRGNRHCLPGEVVPGVRLAGPGAREGDAR